MRILSSFIHAYAVQNQYDFLSSVEHKKRRFEACSCYTFPYNESEWELFKFPKSTNIIIKSYILNIPSLIKLLTKTEIILQKKLAYSPSSCSKPVEQKRRYFEECSSDVFHCLPKHFFSILWKSVGTINCLATHILQNILSCSTHERNSYMFGITGVSKWWTFSIFWVNYPFKNCSPHSLS